MQESKTHFEQIPVETVKEIAQGLPENNDGVSGETQDEVTSPLERWRDVAQKVQQEQDPNRMIELVQQLIATFDEEQLRKRLRPRTGDARNQSGSSET
jgi:hypothetical protein